MHKLGGLSVPSVWAQKITYRDPTKFLNLQTSKMILHHEFTPLPMPQEVIDHVNRLRALDKQPELLTFFDQLGQDVSDL